MTTETKWNYKVKTFTDLSFMEFQGMAVRFLVQKNEMPEMASYHIDLRPGLRIPPSYHKIAHEVIFVLEGSGVAHLNDDEVEIKKGDVILVQPNTWHSFSTQEESLRVLAITSPYVDNNTDLYHS